MVVDPDNPEGSVYETPRIAFPAFSPSGLAGYRAART